MGCPGRRPAMSFESVPLIDCAPGQRAATCPGRWFRRVLVASSAEPVEGRTAEGDESGLLLLSGTVDLEAGAGSWISRGTRPTPYQGKPVAVYLPPKTHFRASGGRSDLLLLSARRPELPPVAEEPGRSAPLLPLAGSGKAFDRTSGSWQPIESFADSPEAILPRRITERQVEGAVLQTVFGPSYKALGLTLTEIVLAAAGRVTVPPADLTASDGKYPEEWAVYYRAEQGLDCSTADRTETLAGEGVLVGSGQAVLTAGAARVYLAAACSGPKSTT